MGSKSDDVQSDIDKQKEHQGDPAETPPPAQPGNKSSRSKAKDPADGSYSRHDE